LKSVLADWWRTRYGVAGSSTTRRIARDDQNAIPATTVKMAAAGRAHRPAVVDRSITCTSERGNRLPP